MHLPHGAGWHAQRDEWDICACAEYHEYSIPKRESRFSKYGNSSANKVPSHFAIFRHDTAFSASFGSALIQRLSSRAKRKAED